MRRVFRTNEIPENTKEWLRDWSDELNKKLETEDFSLGLFWKNKRNTAKIKSIHQFLCAWARPQNGCMYCLASEGTDIDHFYPKEGFPTGTFDHQNYVLCCTACGRFKGSQFPIDVNGAPLLINPLKENPWDHIEFDPITGCLSPKYFSSTSTFSEKGTETNNWLQSENRQWLTDNYLHSYNNLKSEFETFLSNPRSNRHFGGWF